MTPACLIMKLRLSERRTEGNGSRLWRTPGAQDSEGRGTYASEAALRKRLANGHQLLLTEQVKFQGMWPTPDTQNGRDGSKTRKALKGRHGLSLHHAVSIWPTPTARDYKDGTAQSCQNVPENGLLGRAVHSRKILGGGTEHAQESGESSAGAGGQLNPTWVEWLMGFPLGWTDLNASETL